MTPVVTHPLPPGAEAPQTPPLKGWERVKVQTQKAAWIALAVLMALVGLAILGGYIAAFVLAPPSLTLLLLFKSWIVLPLVAGAARAAHTAYSKAMHLAEEERAQRGVPAGSAVAFA